jgi:taurine transport system substrate-binding protein
MIVNAKWAAEHEGFMVALVKVLAKADAQYRANKAKWTADSPRSRPWPSGPRPTRRTCRRRWRCTPSRPWPSRLGPNWLGGAAVKAMTSTAAFLKEQGRIQEIKPDYKAFVTDAYVKKAMAK